MPWSLLAGGGLSRKAGHFWRVVRRGQGAVGSSIEEDKKCQARPSRRPSSQPAAGLHAPLSQEIGCFRILGKFKGESANWEGLGLRYSGQGG